MWNLKVKKGQYLHPYRETIAYAIADKIIILQQRLVQMLHHCDRYFSYTQKKILLLVFCLAYSAYSSYLFCHVMFAKTQATAIRNAPIPPVAQPPPIYWHKDSGQVRP